MHGGRDADLRQANSLSKDTGTTGSLPPKTGSAREIRQPAALNSIGLRCSRRIDSLGQEMRDEFSIMVVDVIDQPCLDKIRKSF